MVVSWWIVGILPSKLYTSDVHRKYKDIRTGKHCQTTDAVKIVKGTKTLNMFSLNYGQ